MKSIALLLMLAAFAACNNSGTTESTAEKKDSSNKKKLNDFPQVSSDSVVVMYNHYRKLSFDINTNVIQVMTLNTDILERTLTSGNIRLIAGAYTTGPQKDEITFFLRVNDPDKPETYLYYDVRSLFAAAGNDQVICPPPGDCSVPIVN